MRLSIVMPCYNEEAGLTATVGQLLPLLEDLAARGKITSGNLWLVDDGSRDGTWHIIERLAADPRVVGVKLSRNRGHQNALLAGLLTADGDAVISLDADLQDDIAVIEEMLDAFNAGNEVVFGVRRSRKDDTFFKRWSARRYYGLLRVLGVDVVPDHAEFRLLGRAALNALAQYPETNLFLRGLVPQLGFRSARVFYDRKLRLAGETKYPLGRMVGLGIDGITSFSAVPLRLIAAGGAMLFVLSTLVALWVIGVRLFTDRAVPGWASTTLPIYALGGVQLLCLGVVGEYVAKIYLEVKRRPRYIIERLTGDRRVVIESRHKHE
ncbi:MAG TPA: glycosyltransferase family 2 protein, partial [Steroidobacteraceae bacterium]|nr:glycosyltransferase family 2 protein [Steroidobacteraceae bacterium]